MEWSIDLRSRHMQQVDSLERDVMERRDDVSSLTVLEVDSVVLGVDGASLQRAELRRHSPELTGG